MIEPVRGACFPCGEIPRYRKKAVKKPPKKADHKHEYEPVILGYINKYSTLSRERGFVAGQDYSAGRRCKICGKLDYGFPDGTHPNVDVVVHIPWGDSTRKRIMIAEKYRQLPVVQVKDYWTLEKEEEN